MKDWLQLLEVRPLWPYLRETNKPIVLYGMGDGALKIMKVLERFGIPLAGIFASDEFVRGHSFAGFPVRSLTQTEAALGEVVVLLAFGTERPGLMAHIEAIAAHRELYAPDVPVCADDETLFDLDYLHAHANALREVYARLADARSRDVFLDVLRYKLSGNIHYLSRSTTPFEEVQQNILKLQADEVFVDLGAYNGDTVRRFAKAAPGYTAIYAVEPDPKNFRKLCHNTAELARVYCHNVGVHERPDTLLFARKAGRQSSLSTGGVPTVVTSVDALLDGKRASFLKFDVEGAEGQALRGCRETIRVYSPKMEIAAYHRNSDLWLLPQMIWEMKENYQLFLRHHPYFPAWETNFYALPPKF